MLCYTQVCLFFLKFLVDLESTCICSTCILMQLLNDCCPKAGQAENRHFWRFRPYETVSITSLSLLQSNIGYNKRHMFAGLKLLVEPIDDGEIRDLFCYRCTCEKKNCLRSIGNNFDPFATIKHSRKSVHYLSTLDKENAIREAIISNLDRQEFSGKRIRPKYFIGSKVVPGVAHHQVCRDAFCKVYQVSSYKLRDIIEGIKNGVCMSAPSFGKRSAVPHDILSRIESQAKKKIKMGYERSVQRMGMAAGHRTMVAADWMASYFEMMGKFNPFLPMQANSISFNLSKLFFVQVTSVPIKVMKYT